MENKTILISAEIIIGIVVLSLFFNDSMDFFKFSLVVFAVVVGAILYRDRKQIFVKKEMDVEA